MPTEEMFMIWYKYYHQNVIAFWANLSIAYVASNPISIFLRQFYPWDLGNFADSIIIFFFIAALIIRWFVQIVALLPWTFPFPLPSPTFLTLFCCNKFVSISLAETFVLSWEIVSKKFLRDPRGNSYCKKDYSKDKLNVVEFT